MIIRPVIKKSILSQVVGNILGNAGSVSEVTEKYLFGYRVPVLEGRGGYSSTEVWVIDHVEEPSDNLLSSVRITAGKNDTINEVTIGTVLSQAELDQTRIPIAMIGLYRADTDKLVKAVEFRGAAEIGYRWATIPFDFKLTEGVTYYFGTAVNGWTKWPEYNPSEGGSIVYTLNESQVLEDIGGLENRTSSWMVPVYFSLDRKTSVPAQRELATLSGEYQHWMLQAPLEFGVGDSAVIKFKTDKDMTGLYYLDDRKLGGTAFLIVNSEGSWDWSDGIASVTVDGVNIPKYAAHTSNDGLVHEVVVTFAEAGTLDTIGCSQWDSNWFTGEIYSLTQISNGEVVYYNELTNRSMGGAQEPTIGKSSMVMKNYAPTVWQTLL